LPITDRSNEYTDALAAALKVAGVRCEVDKRQEKTGFKIREAQLQKIPYMVVIGDKEMEEGTVSVRLRDSGKSQVMAKDEFVAAVLNAIATKAPAAEEL
ncbi:MAG: threonine--tRNA ligase, partial [Christensenellaceae bacterium]|nr:threonine--tRNA ligase [Christensenellaceae bacterium]